MGFSAMVHFGLATGCILVVVSMSSHSNYNGQYPASLNNNLIEQHGHRLWLDPCGVEPSLQLYSLVKLSQTFKLLGKDCLVLWQFPAFSSCIVASFSWRWLQGKSYQCWHVQRRCTTFIHDGVELDLVDWRQRFCIVLLTVQAAVLQCCYAPNNVLPRVNPSIHESYTKCCCAVNQ